MICEKCKAENPDGEIFCIECGASLQNKVNLKKENNPFEEGNPYQQRQENNYVQTPSSTYSPQHSLPAYRQPQVPYQPPIPDYQQPKAPYQQTMVDYPVIPNPDENQMTALDWLGRWAINLIPLVGPIIYVIMLFVWAFGDTEKKSLKTFAQAQLILYAIGTVFLILFIS